MLQFSLEVRIEVYNISNSAPIELIAMYVSLAREDEKYFSL